MAKVGVAFAASALLTYLIGDAMLRRRDALLHDDSRLHERVRARVTELVSYPDAIEVQIAEEGVVRVSGHVLTAERDRLLSQLTQVPRVYRVYNALISVDDAGALTRAAFSNADPALP
jgi:hypothetical protein